MYKVIKLTEDTNPINNFTIGKIKSIEIIGDTDSSDDVNINLLRKVKYQTPDKEYIDTIPAEGTTVTSAKNYALPLTYTSVDGTSGEIVETEVDVTQGGLKLYATLDDGTIDGFRNGYWDLTFQDSALGSDPEKRDWTLTNFKYVNGVKTTVIQFAGSTDRATTPDTLTLRHTTSFDKYDEIELTLTATEETIADVYCSGSVLTTVGWTIHDEEVEIEILDTTITSETMATGRTIIDLESSFFANFNDKFVFDGDIETLRKLNIFIYIES